MTQIKYISTQFRQSQYCRPSLFNFCEILSHILRWPIVFKNTIVIQNKDFLKRAYSLQVLYIS